MFGNLKLGRYEFRLRALAESVLPPFLGSTLRGAFGHALKEVACSVPHRDCSRCLLTERCLYPRLFETQAPQRNGSALLKTRQDAPRPFIFLPPLPSKNTGFFRARDDFLRWRVSVAPGNTLDFNLSLFGSAIRDLPYMIYAVSLMAQQGFGFERAPFELEEVFALDAQGEREVIYTTGNRIKEHSRCNTTLARTVEVRMAQLAAATSSLSAIGNQITLRFVTPTRLRIKGQVLETPSFAQLVSSTSLRLSMLSERWGDESTAHDYRSMIELAREVSTLDSSLCLMALDRYSNRRHGKIALDGFMGDITFSGSALRELLPLLVAGECLHVGSGTAFGLGRYTIVN